MAVVFSIALHLACTPVPELTLDVQSDVTRIAAVGTGDSSDQTTTVHSNVSGGVEPYHIIWTVKDPMGQTRTELLDDPQSTDPIFTAGPLIGPYLLTCMLTDGAFKTLTDSTIIYVSQDVGLSLSLDRQEVPNGGGLNGQATIDAEAWGGSPPYSYAWSVVGPDGKACDDRLSGTGLASRVFTSDRDLGTYRIQCKLTDATGAIATEFAEILVDDLLSLTVSANRPVVTPGGGTTGQTLLTAHASGGKQPYTYAWAITGPDGGVGQWLNDATLMQPMFTSPSDPGTYRAACTATDARGQQVVASMLLLVDQQLSISTTTSRQRVAIDGGIAGRAVVSAMIVGGTAPYSYHWIVLDPNGDDASARVDDVHSASPVFTSTSISGTYRFICEVTDGVGQIAADALEISVGEQLTAQLTVTSPQTANGSSVNPGSEWVSSGGGPNGEAVITAEAIGGSPPYTYAWTIVGPDGSPANDRLTGTSPYTRFFTSSNVLGTYRVTCTITDATGLTANESVKLAVYDSMQFSATMDRVQMPAGGGVNGTAHLHGLVNGGTPPFTYTWTVIAPNGQIDNTGLDDPSSADPVFTSGVLNGIYRVTCVVADSVGQAAQDSLLFMVGQGVTLDVVCDKTDVIAAGGQAHLIADARGGIPPYQYEWRVTNPLGATENERLDDTAIATPVFTSALLTGTYSFTCTATDAAGFVAILSTNLVVGGGLDQGLSIDVTASRQSIPVAGGQVSLAAAVLGGVPPVTYAWTVVGPLGDVTAGTLDDAAIPAPTFTAPAVAGTYQVSCSIIDNVLKRFTDSIIIYVGMPLSLEVACDRQSIPSAGGQAALRTIVTGGESPFTYAWSVLDPSGAGASASLSNTTAANPVFTAPATPGTYQFNCVVTDDAGATDTASMQVYVGMGLSSDLTASKQSLPSGQSTVITAAPHGGISPHTYTWTALSPSGANASAALSATNVANPTFTAPAAAGTYRLTCTITDAASATFVQSIHIYVGMPLTLDTSTDRLGIPAAGGQAALVATANGGTSPYVYAWTALDPAGASATATLSNVAVANPTFTAPAAPGTYRFTCTVTDAAGTTAVSSLEVYVGMSLSANLTATKQSLPSGQTTVVTAAGHGGISPYTYAWSALNPGGANASAALSATNVAAPTFTAPATAGTYRLTCTVTDSVNATFAQSILIEVGMPLTLDVCTDEMNIPAAGGQAILIATANGGTSPYTYAWSALNPSDVSAAASLSGTAVSNPTFTAPAAVGTYQFTCTVTDAAGVTARASLQVYVGMGLSCDLTATKQSLPSGQTTVITAAGHGGVSPYTFAWTALDPSGANAAAALSSTSAANPTFTAPAIAGTYRLTCTVTDSVNATFTKSIHIQVGMPLTLDVRTDKLSIPATGGQAVLTATANGGVSGYTYAWSALNPSGASANAALSNTAIANPTFTAPASPGTYRFTCTVTDAASTTAIASLEIYVGTGLSCDLTATKQSLPSGQTTVITATGRGGVSPYTYAWAALNPSGADASAALSATNVANPTFTAPATAGTYRLTCTATDSANATFTQSIHISVGMPLTLDVRTDRLNIPATGGHAALTATANGGVSPYTYAWTALNPGGANANASLSSLVASGSTFTAPAGSGTYRFACTVTDAAGTTAAASLQIYVGIGLFATVTTTKESLPSGQTATLDASAQGGIAPYTYSWAVLNPSGVDASTALDATNTPAPIFTAPATAGTYRFTCTVTDSANATFAQSIHIYVGMPLSLDVRSDKLSVPATGGQAALTATPNGGVSPYTYVWTALNPSGASANASLSSLVAAASTFTAPAGAGTYRFVCTVTDAAGTSFADSLDVYVGMGLSAAITTTKASLPSGQTAALNVAAQGGVAPYTYSWAALNPSGADASTALTSTTAAAPTFTAPATAGTYRFTCTVTDTANATFIESIHIQVGMPLTLDVCTDKLTIPATGGQAALTATVNGGVWPYTYAWTATDPSGADASATLTSTTAANPTFTAPADVGTYLFACTVTDAAGTTAVASLQVYVGIGLFATVTTTKESLPSGQTAALNASAQGGIAPYTYAWAVLNPSGADASTSLSSTTVATPTFTAPVTAGTYRLTCTVTDSANATFAQSIHISVGMTLSAYLHTNRLNVPAAGGQAVLTATATGGISPYTYAWTALNPSGASATAALSATNVANPTFTAPAGDGTYRFTCTVTDTAGMSFISSIDICVGMSLSAALTTTKDSLPSGQTAALDVTAQGGIAPYVYSWTVLGPTGADASSALTSTTAANPTFTAPATAGTYRLTCTVTDAANASFAQSIHIYVGMPLSLDVCTDKLSIPAAGGQAALTATATGGISSYTYAWTAADPTGGDAAAALSDPAIAAPVFTAPATPGTYRFACTVTDDAGTEFTDSLTVYVGMGLSAAVTTTKASLPSGRTATLNASPQGGVAPYTYSWAALNPSGADASTALDATNIAAPIFTAPATAGTYRFTCTVADSANAIFVQSIHIYVGMPLSLDVRSDKMSISATGGQTALTATANGGVSPYTYAWTALNPSGASAAASLSNVAASNPTFTAPAGAGTYRFTCTVTDAAGTTFAHSLDVYVGMGLSVAVTTTKESLPSGQTAALNASAQGGLAPYTYSWAVLNPAGADASTALTSTTASNPTFTAPGTAGTYRFTCTVTDSANATFAQSIHIQVGMPLTANVSTDKLTIPATGGQAALIATPNGGVSPYTYAWTALDPSGASANASLSSLVVDAPTFTAPADAGSYRFVCTVTDSAGATFSDSVAIHVGMGLSAIVTTTKESVPAGQTATLNVAAQGGVASYSYAWSVLDPSGVDASTALDATDTAGPIFTAPATAGTYRLTCTVTDSVNATFVQSIHIQVGMPLTLDVNTDKLNIATAGGQANLRATANGGVSPYTYAWSALNPSGASAAASLSATNVNNPTFTAPATPGTYRFTCTVTDAAAASASMSLQVYVGMGLSVAVTTTKESLPSGQAATLNASAQGGVSPYTYTWTALNPSGANAAAALSATNVASPIFTAPATAGTYRLTCTVADAAGSTFAQSIHIQVGMPLTLDVITDSLSIAATGGQAALTATANGGISAYTYAWTATDPAGADAAATLSDTAIAAPVFTAPATPGTYRFTCRVTDAANATANASLEVLVGTSLSADVTATKQSLPSGQTTVVTAAGHGGTSPYTYAWTALNPSSGNAATALSATNIAAPTFTAPATAGTYRLTCTVTDDVGATFSVSLHILVGMPLSLDIVPSRASIPASAGTATLTATANGGASPYTYAWTAADPSGGDASTALSGTAIAAPVFTAPATAGTYRFTCTVTDSAGATFRDSVAVYVGMGLSVAVSATKESLPSGQTTVVTAAGHGGISPYTYAWTALNPSGASAAAALSATNVAAPTFTAPATAGTYRLTCTVTDAANETVATSMHINVGQPLSIDVTAADASIPVTGGATTLSVTVQGGISAYTYAWSALDQSGANANAAINNLTIAAPTFTAPAGVGTYRITCIVTDSAGATSADSTTVQVGMPLSAYILATRTSMPSTKTSTLTVTNSGGTSPYTYSWSVLNPSGSNVAATALSSTTATAPTFTAPATAGAYRVTCTVTDGRNATAVAPLQLYVGMPLTLDVNATKSSLVATKTAVVTASPNGGVGPYTYSWSVTDSSGANQNTALSSLTTQSPTFTAPATSGTYRVTCTVTDADGYTVTDSVHIQVGMPLSLAVTASEQVLVTTDTSTLLATASGGISPYTYAWLAYDSANNNLTATVLSSATVSSPTFTAPITGGTYRVGCTVTDSQGSTFTAAVHLEVTTQSITLTNPVTADGNNPTSILTATALNSAFSIINVDYTLTYARNLKLRLVDPNWSLASPTYVAVDGIGPDGHYQTEYFNFGDPGGAAVVTGEKVFSRVEYVRFVQSPTSGTPSGDETISIGVGNIFGVPGVLSSTASIRRVVLLPNTTLNDCTIYATPGAQGVDFTSSGSKPNGSRSYQIFYDDD